MSIHFLSKRLFYIFVLSVIFIGCGENNEEEKKEANPNSISFEYDCTLGRTINDETKWDDIFDGFGSSDVRFKVTCDKESKCNAVIEYTTAKGKGGLAGEVKPGKSKVISCYGTPDDPVIDVIIRCGGSSDKCKGTWEALK